MELLSNGVVKAISWTLIHSLWLGLILAIIAGITILLTKKSSAALRYNLLAVQCVVFLIGMIFTFNYENQAQKSEISKITQNSHLEYNPTEIYALQNLISQDLPKHDFKDNLNNFINDYSTWIVCFWFLFFIFKLLKMLNELRSIYRIRNYQIIEPSQMWKDKLENLKDSLRINRNIKLLESKLVRVPSVTGFLKPIILIPIGLLNNLPQDQVEAILLHELAHIKRSDYFINLIQSLMETLFFFNPGVLWISSLLKEERENCCDDLAIGVTNNKKVFVNALISFQQYNVSNQNLTMEFGNRKANLKNRAKRILFNDPKVLNTLEKSFLSVCIIFGSALCFAFATYDSNPKESPQKNTTNTISTTKTTTVSTTESTSETSTISDSLYINRKYYPDSIPEGTIIYFSDEIENKKYFSYLFKHQGILYQMSRDLETIAVNGKKVNGSEKAKYAQILKPFVADFESNRNDELNKRTSTDRFESASARIEENSTEIEKNSRIIEEQSKLIEIESKRVEIESRRVEAQSKRVEAESRRIEKESKKIEAESKRIEAESKRIEAELKKRSTNNS